MEVEVEVEVEEGPYRALYGSDEIIPFLNGDFGFWSVSVCAFWAAHFVEGETEAQKLHEKEIGNRELELRIKNAPTTEHLPGVAENTAYRE